MKNELPDGWEWKSLGYICEIVGGKPNPKGEEPFKEGTIPFVKMKDLGKYHLTTNLTKTETSFNDKFVNESNSRIIKKGAILIPRSGSVALNHRAVLGVDACIVSHICALELKDSNINEFYLYYVLTKIDMRKYMKKTTGLDLITFQDLKKITVPVPTFETQHKIVAILKKTEEIKKLRAQADEFAQQLLQSVFLEMFGDPVKNPMNWEKKMLKEFGEIKTGNTPSRKQPEYYGNNTEWIKSGNINTPYTYLTRSEEMLSEKGVKEARIAPKNSILVTCIAGSLSCIGNVAIADREVAFNQQINAIIPCEKVNEVFLYYLILNSKKHIQNHSTKSMKGMISKTVFSSIYFILPPIKIQNQFAAFAKKIGCVRKLNYQSYQEISILFNTLMQKAFTGELIS